MTVSEIKDLVMFQTNNDKDDLGDFMPYLMGYINQGYDRLVYAYDKQHVPSEEYPPLYADTDVPNLPEWMHHALADWATWLIYCNGNPQKQQRGYPFRSTADETLNQALSEGGKNGRITKFKNIPW